MNGNPNYEAKAVSGSCPKQQFPAEAALREYGVDAAFIAERLVNMFDAMCMRWDPATKSWRAFEDNPTRLEALRLATILLGLPPTQKGLEARHRPGEIKIRVVYAKPPRIPAGPRDRENCKTN